MGALETLSRVFLVVTNIFFLVIGLVLFGAGLFVRFGSAVIDPYLDDVKSSLNSSASGSGLGTLDFSAFDVSEVLFGLSLGLIFFGLFLIVVTMLGCCGSCYKIKAMLIAYLIITVVLLVAQIVVVGILYGSPDTFHDPAKKKLKDTIQSDYAGLNGTDIVSLGWNIVMQQAKCCGSEDYTDFTGAQKWVISYAGYTLKTPLACCKTLPTSSDYACASTTGATDTNNYLNTGCYGKIWDDTLGNTLIMAISLGTIGLFQILLVVFGIYLLCKGKNNKTSPRTPRKK